MYDLPKHLALSIEYNPHKLYCETVEQFIDDKDFCYNFINEEDKQLCINQNILIVVTWYPRTPIGSCNVSGSNLNEILKFIKDVCKND